MDAQAHQVQFSMLFWEYFNALLPFDGSDDSTVEILASDGFVSQRTVDARHLVPIRDKSVEWNQAPQQLQIALELIRKQLTVQCEGIASAYWHKLRLR